MKCELKSFIQSFFSIFFLYIPDNSGGRGIRQLLQDNERCRPRSYITVVDWLDHFSMEKLRY